ncbi:CDP-alcohol phosphatidyltransferase family protein [Candidatus Phytoplasma oryzae]|uniref:CDP-alcohol phosphatidyltransferase family protein n=2 Tax=Candidatus Phytoplasma oryzae TaxID=203274 RepID=A0A139JQM9_9MOLU|nr:CDP-alcohol phosphatidyltransferase family protein [Candidatus Phytoplasma oryzae]KXT29287.1 CDP-alcohol phosphatidyltransferase family protein [Candidatus Phytoplasma oryzae]RAM57677.1 hypothetical protein DH96_02170 [Candidatus Phytoplasma oryzae]
MFLGLYNYTVLLTYLNLLSGFLGISLAISNNNFVYASIFLLISGILDMFDGFISRCKKKRSINEKKYGIQIDSLADIVSFGILPVLIGWSFLKKEYISQNSKIFLFYNSLEYFKIFFLFCGSLYVLTALIRLAYFNIMHDKEEEFNSEIYYTGVPVTFASFIFPFLVLLRNISQKFCNTKYYFVFFQYYLKIFPIFYLLAIILLSFLFIFDKIKIKKQKNIFLIMLLSLFLILLMFLIYLFYNDIE